MALNTKYIEKQRTFYEGKSLPVSPISFYPKSPYSEEIWVWVNPYIIQNILPYTYKVSNYGRVYSEPKAKKYRDGIMCPSKNGSGYHQITFKGINGERICTKVARLVLLHFHFNPYCYLLEVDHLDGNKDNNNLSNLEWVTPQENTHRAIKNELRPLHVQGELTCETLLTNEQAYQLYEEAIYNKMDYDELAEKYGVTLNYIFGLINGEIRPYIANRYYNKNHIDL